MCLFRRGTVFASMKKPRTPEDRGRGGLICGGIDGACFRGIRGWERAGQTKRAGSGAAAQPRAHERKCAPMDDPSGRRSRWLGRTEGASWRAGAGGGAAVERGGARPQVGARGGG